MKSEKSPRFPWYQRVESDELQQGDIFFDCPVIEFTAETSFPLSQPAPVAQRSADLIILTQSCDLVQGGKVEHVLLCAHFDVFQEGLSKSHVKELAAGRRPRHLLLERSEIAGLNRALRVVDFSAVYRLPLPFVRRLAAAQTPRLRLLPPYREHLSQAFARFFMRVGLPQDIRLD